mgnify:FL=1
MAKFQQVIGQKIAAKTSRRIKAARALGICAILCGACTPPALEIAATATLTPPATAAPTITATATPTRDPYEMDLEKLHNLPESYEYLLAHLDEFVQAPDPLADKAAFDRWWNEEFLPAIGEPLERSPDVEVHSIVEHEGFEAMVVPGGDESLGVIIDQPGFFYFKHGGEIFAVPVVDVAYKDNRHTNDTVAIILSDCDISRSMERSITTSLDLLNGNGGKIYRIEMFNGELGGEFSEVVRELSRRNIFNIDYSNRIVFGIGFVRPQ